MREKRCYPRTVKQQRPLRVSDSGPQTLRLLIADAHPILREGLKGLFRGTFVECVGEASTGLKTLELARRFRPDVLLLEPVLPDMDGLELLRAVKRAFPKMAIVIFTGQEDPELAFQAALSGADGYCSKGGSSKPLMDLLKHLAAGRPVDVFHRPSFVANGSRSGSLPRKTISPDRPPLSRREEEILRCLALGLRTSEISESLRLQPETVRTHVKNIFRKIGVTSRTQAVLWAIKKGLVKGGGPGH